ncbi:MAG: hypothetical protein P1P84_24850 [Deferrisomatales bacterium]|nr:hypothetical protein [Deferrisomatales bacterium]
MEDVIIGLLFVYFFVIRPLLKQVRKGDAKQPGAGPRRAPLGTLLEKLKEKLQEAAEQVDTGKRGQAGNRPANSWKELFAEATRKTEPEPGETVPGPHGLANWPVEPSRVPEATVQSQETAAPPGPEPTPVAPARATTAPASQGVQVAPTRRPARFGVNLREAVVWSEILGPPVSLRDGS